MAGTLDITATIGERAVSRDEVLAWEADRAAAVYKKLGMGEPPADLGARRDLLVARKLELGHTELERRLRREMATAARSSRVMTALSRSRRRLCTVELRGIGGKAEAMPAFYAAAMASGDEAPLLAASPDHYVLRQDDDGVQQVIETTGGSPLASRIFLGDADSGPVTTEADPAFPVQWVAIGRASLDGPPSGAIRHQFRDEPDGFVARLTIEFPRVTPGRFVRAHRWHLACEFSNWIEAANAAS
ncbi:MAG TPA: hypothetical protein VN671_07525 [Solirubrobacterales bacterium]|nr:hypothetical protein [Solirubrobacterales bacterium]